MIKKTDNHKKRTSRIIIGFILLVLSATTVLGIFQPKPALAASNAAQDLQRRQLHTFIKCLEREKSNNSPLSSYGDLYPGDMTNEDVVVGLDRNSQNGVITCKTAISEGAKAYDSTITNVDAWLLTNLTGSADFSRSNSLKIDDGKVNNLINNAEAKMKFIGAPVDDLRRIRILPLVNACYDIKTTAAKSGFDFQYAGGYFYRKPTSTILKYVQNGLGIKDASNVSGAHLGDVELHFAIDSSFGDKYGSYEFDNDFYPIGDDINQTSGHVANAIIGCNWITQNQNWKWLLQGSTIGANGQLIGPNKKDVANPATNQDGTGNNSPPGCEASGINLSWIVCPIIDAVSATADFIFNSLIVPLLQTNLNINPNKPIYQVWSSFRNIANVLLIIFLLIAVYAQATGGGLIDAYTAKKIIPRVVAAAILINISIYLVAGLVDITTIIGNGIVSLMYAPFKASGNFTIKPGAILGDVLGLGVVGLIGGMFSAAAVGAAISVAVQALPFLLLFVVVPALLAFIGVLVTLVIREGLIIFLVMVAPVAAALYCLPNTEQYFRKWFDLLFKALLVYPIVMVVFAMCNIMAYLLSNFGGNQIIGNLIALLLLVLPLFIIPFAFKLAGGLIGNIYGTLAGWGKQGHGFFKGNPNDPNSLGNRVKRQAGEGITREQARVVRGARDKDAGRWRRAVGRAAQIGNVDQRLSNYNRLAAERRAQLSDTGDDALIYAGAGYTEYKADGTLGYYNAKGKEIGVNEYNEGKRLYGQSSHSIAQGLAYTLQKAQTDEDVANFRKSFARNAQANGWSQDEVDGVWATATYPHKGSFSSEWYSKPEINPATGDMQFRDITSGEYTNADGKVVDSYDGFIGDLHKTRESFRLGQLRDSDWRAMFEKQTQLEDKVMRGETLSEREARQLAQTYEVFDAASQTYGVGRGEGDIAPGGAAGGEVRAATGTAAAQPIIKKAREQMAARGFGLETQDAGTRIITKGTPPPTGSRGPVTGSAPVATAKVTGTIDRDGVPDIVDSI